MRCATLCVPLLVACSGSDSSPLDDREKPDAATPTSADAQADAEPDAGAHDAGLCVSSIRLPTAMQWSIAVEFTNGVATTTALYNCPSADVAVSCGQVLRGALRPDESGGYVYPHSEACFVEVPTSCLPCTGGAKVW